MTSEVQHETKTISPLLALALFCSNTVPAADYDVIIRGGRIVDGSGAPWYRADLGIRAGKIVAIGHVEGTSTDTIEAQGLVVAPGFIDMMDRLLTMVEDPTTAFNLLSQGITTSMLAKGVQQRRSVSSNPVAKASPP